MRPLTILTGFVLGTAVSITFSMAVVGLLFWVLAPDYPQLQPEIRPLLVAAGLFLALTAASGLSFISLLRAWRGRWLAQLVMWVILAAVVNYFLP